MTSAPQRERYAATCPAWVLQQLHRQGLPGIGHDQTKTPNLTGRPTPFWHSGSAGRSACGQPVLAGDAWPTTAVLDPTPTTVDGELFALLAGRTTYELSGDRREIWPRTPHMIVTANADTVRVYISHKCYGPLPIPNSKWAPPTAKQFTEIPF